MKLSSLTDIGSRRLENQDNYWASRLEIDGNEAGIICLCDGMGGLSDGALASKVVVSMVREYILNNGDLDKIEKVLDDANKKILANSKKNNTRSGTTCTILLCYEGIYKILHIGDTRCYRLSKGNAELLTNDHSVIAEYKRKGKEISDEFRLKYRNSLIRCIGVKNEVYFDFIQGTYDKGDIFIVCSDGLWHYFEKKGIESIDDLKNLVGLCIENGETDNISIGVLEV